VTPIVLGSYGLMVNTAGTLESPVAQAIAASPTGQVPFSEYESSFAN
jgi:hypothetical protein